MSTTSGRRIKEGGGGGRGTTPTGKVTPVSVGKENPRPSSRVRAATQKPTLKPMARVDKSAVAVAAEDSRFRRSLPRGRSSSPSEFTRPISDLRKNPHLANSMGKENTANLKGLGGRLGEKSHLVKKFGKNLANDGKFLGEVGGVSQKNDKIKVANNGGSDLKQQTLGLETPNLEKNFLKDCKKNGGRFQENEERTDKARTGNTEEKGRNSTSTLEKGSDIKEVGLSRLEANKVGEEIKMKPSRVGVRSGPSGSTSRESKMVDKISNCAGALRENASANRYPSKLHEKLAFLEGKVKRIASDIKKTKEILDLNNPDTSKMMLSDIQEKITGIEKAMVFVKRGEQNQNAKEENEEKDGESSAKGLNAEELEARAFPHHKLIRDRTSSKTTSRGFETHVVEVGESRSTVVVDEKNHTFENNAIAVELLASLNIEESHGPEARKIQEMDDSMTSRTEIAESSSFTEPRGKNIIDALLMADERLNDFYKEESRPAIVSEDEVGENYTHKLNDIGHKISTGGWFMSEGESILLAHGDGSCTFYDIANSEVKAEYEPPTSVFPNIWQDCWIIRAPNADGCSGRYVVAASAGNPLRSGFCSWDFYTKEIHAYHFEDGSGTNHARPAHAPLSNKTMRGRPSLSTAMATENSRWWCRPCGPLIMSGSSCQKMVQVFDIRDGEQVMKWELQKPLSAMDYASPLQWRNRGKVAIAESDSISVWDVSSLSSQPLQSVSSCSRMISALHVNNTEAELGGGVRQRVSSVEAEGNDGVFCTSDSINVLDFRLPSGIGLKIPKVGVEVQSAFSRGDSIYIGCCTLRSKQYSSQIQEFSLRRQRLFSTYTLPESNAHSDVRALTQVWGSSSYVMGVCGLGLFVFDSLKDEALPSLTMDYINSQNMEIIGPNNMSSPSFDYSSSRVLLISKDRPAQWRYLF